MEPTLIGTGIRLPREHITKLDQIATAKRVSRNVVILWAIDEYLRLLSLPDCLPGKTNDQEESQPADPIAAI